MRKFVILGMCLAFLGLLTGCNGSKESLAQNAAKKPLVVAMELAYPPFEMKDKQGNPSGVSPDLAKDLGKYLNREVVILNTAWEGLIPSLQTGKADVVISSMSRNKQRSKIVDFSEPYAQSTLGLLVNKASNVQNIEDLNKKDRVIAVKIGTAGYFYAQKYLNKAKIISLADESACAAEVAQAKADAFLYDQLTVYRHSQDHKAKTKAIYAPYAKVDPWCIAVKKGNKELLGQVNSFLKVYRKNGGFEKLSTKYLNKEQKAFKKLGFTWFFDTKGL